MRNNLVISIGMCNVVVRKMYSIHLVIFDQATGWTVRSWDPGARVLSLLYKHHIGPGAHTASCSLRTVSLFPGGLA